MDRKLSWIATGLYLQNKQSVAVLEDCDRLEIHWFNETLPMDVLLLSQETGKTNFEYDK